MTINLIGNAPNQVPTNADLGTAAFTNIDPYVDSRSDKVTVVTGTTVELDSFNAGQFRMVRYMAAAYYPANVYACELMVAHNGTSIYTKEFGNVTNQSFPAGLNGFAFSIASANNTVSLSYTHSAGQDVTVTVTRMALNA
jgi:hypothetical protein